MQKIKRAFSLPRIEILIRTRHQIDQETGGIYSEVVGKYLPPQEEVLENETVRSFVIYKNPFREIDNSGNNDFSLSDIGVRTFSLDREELFRIRHEIDQENTDSSNRGCGEEGQEAF